MPLLILVAAPAAYLAWAQHLANWEKPFNPLNAQLAALEMKIEAYQIDTGQLPRNLADLLSSNGVAKWDGPYAKDADIYDLRGNRIEYQTPSANTFTLTARDPERHKD